MQLWKKIISGFVTLSLAGVLLAAPVSAVAQTVPDTSTLAAEATIAQSTQEEYPSLEYYDDEYYDYGYGYDSYDRYDDVHYGSDYASYDEGGRGGIIFLLAIVLGIAAGCITFFSIRSAYRFKTPASMDNYLEGQTLQFTQKEDHFIREYRTRTRISSGNGGRGGHGGHGGPHPH